MQNLKTHSTKYFYTELIGILKSIKRRRQIHDKKVKNGIKDTSVKSLKRM